MPPRPTLHRSSPDSLKKFLYAAAFAYAAAWGAHVFTGTKALRGFYGDGALAFLIYLSHSYVFGKAGSWVHLFSIGFARDFQMLLNALGLQFALWLHITSAAALEYIFVFWQFALPGFLYLALFYGLRRSKNASWIVFPLVSWAVLSPPVDWTAPNSTRWALPIFWMHFFLVLLADKKIRPWPLAGVIAVGAAMLGGLYESIMLHCVLCIGIGALLWWRRRNKTPFIYALAALPGAVRAFLNYMEIGRHTPNDFSNFAIPDNITDPYVFFIVTALLLIAATASKRFSGRNFFVLLFLLALPAVSVLSADFESVWTQHNLRFDGVFITLGLMACAGLWRAEGHAQVTFAVPAAILALVAGTVLWTVEIEQTFDWQACHTRFMAEKGKDLYTPQGRATWAAHSEEYSQCVWDWSEPWADMLMSEKGEPPDWPVLTFWQNFEFARKDGRVWLHTNNWTLTSPSVEPSEGWLPLKTLVYDLTPLYEKRGLGPLVAHDCIQPEQADDFWARHLRSLDDAQRRLMNVCPRSAVNSP